MEWEVNDTHILFPRNAERAPIRVRTLYFLAGVPSWGHRKGRPCGSSRTQIPSSNYSGASRTQIPSRNYGGAFL